MNRRFNFLGEICIALRSGSGLGPLLARHASNADFRVFAEESLRAMGSVNVAHNGSIVSEIHLHTGFESISVVKTGIYTVSLSTGLILWEHHLTQSDLILTDAFPEQPVLLAAATEHFINSRTHDLRLLDGAVQLIVIPGPNCGTLAIGLAP